MTSLLALPEPLRRAATAEFAGEPVLWASPANPARAFWPAMGIWLFAIPWTAFSLFWESLAIGAYFARPGENLGGAPSGLTAFFALFGVPFVLIGFGMLAGPFWIAWRTRRTVYALSAKRLAIITLGWRRTETISIATRDIAEVKRKELGDGSGDLTVVTGWTRDDEGDRALVSHKLLGLGDVRRVDQMIRQQQG